MTLMLSILQNKLREEPEIGTAFSGGIAGEFTALPLPFLLVTRVSKLKFMLLFLQVPSLQLSFAL
jgi:hypothetical protein